MILTFSLGIVKQIQAHLSFRTRSPAYPGS
jgi:hypothetical protein